MLDGVGHFPWVDGPRAFVAAVEAFLGPHEPTPRAVTAVLFDFGGVVLSSPLEAFDDYERRARVCLPA